MPFRSSGEPIAYLTPPKNVSATQQRARLDLLKQWNTEYAAANPAETSLAARINTYELAYRMQMSATDCTDLSREPECVRKMYGLDNSVTAHFGQKLPVGASVWWNAECGSFRFIAVATRGRSLGRAR